MDKPAQQIQESQRILVKSLRIAGLVFVVAGIGMFFNVVDIAGMLDMINSGLHKVLGGILVIIGLGDIVFVPRLLEMVQSSKNKNRH